MGLDVTHPRVPPQHATPLITDARTMRDLAVMFADIAGSTRLYEILGDAHTHRVVATTLQIMTDAVQACGGRIVKTVGDELLCTYPSADDGARGSIAIQQALFGLQVPEAERVAVRIGVNYGPMVEAKGDVFGDSVNVAARLVEIARPRQILATANCVEQFSPVHRAKARELQLIGVRGRTSYVPVWELLWRSEEPLTQRVFSPARQARKAFLLRVEFRGRSWEMGREGDALSMGREDTSQVRLDDRRASRYHARIVVRNGRFVLIDQSTNGTYVLPEGGEPVAVRSDEHVLTGSGAISFGGPPEVGTELLHYASRPRPVPGSALGAAQVRAARAGGMLACQPGATRWPR